MRCGVVLCAFVGLLSVVQGANILGLFPVSGQSHNHFFSALTTELSRRGHNLTVLTAFPSKFRLPNYREIPVNMIEEFKSNFSPFKHTGKSTISKLSEMLNLFLKLCPSVLQSDQVKLLLKEKFDLVIISTFFNHCFLPFGNYYGVPMIGISSAGSLGLGMDMANPEPSSYVPSTFLPLTSEMTFLERLSNTVMKHLLQFLGKVFLKPSMDAAAKEFFGPNTPHVEDLEKELSLVIYNNHFSLNGPRPLVPGTIEAGGMHIKPSSDPLPKDLQEFMDGAKEGVIYFSMGSFIQGSEFPKEKLDALLDAFSVLKQKVIFKWEEESMPGKPSNVKIGKWLPQQSILSHPNTKLFITHGGLLSTQEAAYHGVPLVGIPFFGDQQLNVAKSARMGLAVPLDFQTLSKQNVLNAIMTVLGNPSYQENAQKLRKRVRDQPESPLERAVFWTEYVLRHEGAPHIRTAATHMPWWQVELLDVYAVIFGTLFLTLLLQWQLLKWCCCRKKASSGRKLKKQ